MPVLPRGPRGPRALRRPVVQEPLAGDAPRALRGGVVHQPARRHLLVARCGRRPTGDRPVERAVLLARLTRRRRLRAHLREPRPRGRCHHRPSPRSDLRVRPCARTTVTTAGGRVATRARSRRTFRRRTRSLAGDGAGGVDVPDGPHDRPEGAGARHHRARRRRSRRTRDDARRRARTSRPVLRHARCPT
jgi:hypothetical protein